MNLQAILSAVAAVAALLAVIAAVVNVILGERLRRSTGRQTWRRETLIPVCSAYLKGFNENVYTSYGMLEDMGSGDGWRGIQWDRAARSRESAWAGMRSEYPTIQLLCSRALTDAAGAMILEHNRFHEAIDALKRTPPDQMSDGRAAVQLTDAQAGLVRAVDRFIEAMRREVELEPVTAKKAL
jgi:hypothetical protein